MAKAESARPSLWMVRARGGENSPYAITHNCAVCSFREFPDLSGYADFEEIRARLASGWSNLSGRQLGLRAGQCHSFALKIEIGDLVFVPNPPERNAAVGRVIGAYRYLPDAPAMCRHQRPVKWETDDLPYDEFPDEIRRLLKSARTVARSSVANAAKLMLAAVAAHRGKAK